MIYDKCGVFGITGTRNAAVLTYFGLYALQHRGQESCGIASSAAGAIETKRGMGKVDEVFSNLDSLKPLKGRIAIGHNRYSTTGESASLNTQPLVPVSESALVSLQIGSSGQKLPGPQPTTPLTSCVSS